MNTSNLLGDELGCVAPCLRNTEILVLKQIAAGWEIPEKPIHHFELLPGGGLCRLAGIDALLTIPRGDVADVVGQVGCGFLTAAFDVRALENDARRKTHPRVCHFSELKNLRENTFWAVHHEPTLGSPDGCSTPLADI